VLAAWPERGLARRLFRLLGMVANKAKRLYVIAINRSKPK
jgi:hypothetical protein